jgi:hypothetical protein
MRTMSTTESNSAMMPIMISGDDARQGVTGHNVRYVLIFGLLGVIAGLGAVGFMSVQGWIGPFPL